MAIKKRLKAVDHIAQNYQAFNTYESLVELLNSTGAFGDCPQGSEAGSAESASASYGSRTTCTGLLHALALDTRLLARHHSGERAGRNDGG